MSRRLLALSAAAAAVLTLAACGSDSAEAGDTAEAAAADGAGACAAHEPLRFSDTGVEGLETLVLEFEDFRVALEEVTGLDVEFQPMSSRTAAATALEYDDLDVLLTGPAEKAEADAIPLVGVTRDNYKAAIFKRTDSDLESVADLEGGTMLKNQCHYDRKDRAARAGRGR
ncbi:PhnD/SsuA/transferrin family substrate-binding protein [Nesterenkonia massiliensis]|uniref:PhnD/SsuA/transferrin family substrate-binding protein n=1 Tax=Nesterenkonia massiliensis TaxID=1232429 RepID=A0ABT2HNN2_9MICC|nr:PhnD/SsuA/transferrin family substrate-binding protein [Nesterenkonia massiliensis]MCT1606297.1 PhnD/SsuA/transferrin family substrate-binding protein [Nesterenkonia massiliensis]